MSLFPTIPLVPQGRNQNQGAKLTDMPSEIFLNIAKYMPPDAIHALIHAVGPSLWPLLGRLFRHRVRTEGTGSLMAFAAQELCQSCIRLFGTANDWNTPSGVMRMVPLSYLALWGHVGLAQEFILQYGTAPLNSNNKLLMTPLQLAVEFGQFAMVQLLLGYGADTHNVDESQRTALCTAVMHKRLEMIDALLRAGADVNCAGGPLPEHKTLLQTAVASGDLEIVRMLLDAGARVHDSEQNGEATSDALTVAIEYAGKKRWIEAINMHLMTWKLQYPTEVETPDDIKKRCMELVILLCSYHQTDLNTTYAGCGASAVYVASHWGRAWLIPYFERLKPGIIHAVDTDNISPLHEAAVQEYMDVFQVLINEGIDWRTKNKWGYTAVDYLMPGQWWMGVKAIYPTMNRQGDRWLLLEMVKTQMKIRVRMLKSDAWECLGEVMTHPVLPWVIIASTILLTTALTAYFLHEDISRMVGILQALPNIINLIDIIRMMYAGLFRIMGRIHESSSLSTIVETAHNLLDVAFEHLTLRQLVWVLPQVHYDEEDIFSELMWILRGLGICTLAYFLRVQGLI